MAKTSNSNMKHRANKYSLWKLSAQWRTGFGLCTIFSVTVAKYAINTYRFVKVIFISFLYLVTVVFTSTLYIFLASYITFAVTVVFTVLIPFAGAEEELGRGT